MKMTRFSLALFLVLLTALTGCKNPFSHKASAPPAVPVAHVAARPQPLPVDFTKVQPNEVGEIPILEYHQLITTGKPSDYTYPVNAFKADMERLYSLGYRPISLSDLVEGHVDCPAGTSPVVLTFDDALRGQLDYTPDGKISPNCAVGILQAMHSEHPDWPLKATFFVLPAKGTSDYFYQSEYSQSKLQWLAANGFELGNHTIHHLPGIKHWPDTRVETEFGDAAKMIDDNVPGYKVQTLALPYGVFPKNQKLVITGTAPDGNSYHNICALLAGAAPVPSPVTKQWNPYRLQRIIPAGMHSPAGSIFTEGYWLDYLEKNKIKKYVSDGDPNTFTVPKLLAAQVVPARLKATGCMLRTY